MNSPFRRLTIFQKFFITLTIIFVVAIAEYQSFLQKSSKVELYDSIHREISSARVSISKLEYLLDMFVMAWKLEYGTIDIIRESVDELMTNLNALREDPRYSRIWEEDAMLTGSVDSIQDDLATIRDDLKRLNDAMSQDEIILLHNSIDTNTVLVTAKAERLLSYITERRQAVFREFKNLALMSVAGFVLLMLSGSFLFYRKIFFPVNRAVLTTKKVLSGDGDAVFAEDDATEAGRLGAALNRMLAYFRTDKRRGLEESALLMALSKDLSGQLSAISSLMTLAGRSLAASEVFNEAMRQAASSARSSAGAVYTVEEGSVLRLRAAYGLDEGYIRQAHTLSLPLESLNKSISVFDRVSMANPPLAAVLEERSIELVVSAPLFYNREFTGVLLSMYRDRTSYSADLAPFLEAAAASIAVASGHSALFQKELLARKFLERILNQLPHGLAVFDRGGRCALMNVQARLLLGAEVRFDHSSYSVLEDDLLKEQGMVTSIKKSYEGYSTEFIIKYSALSTRALGLSGPVRKLRIKSFPVYDSGGEISHVALMYEDLTESEPAGAGNGAQ